MTATTEPVRRAFDNSALGEKACAVADTPEQDHDRAALALNPATDRVCGRPFSEIGRFVASTSAASDMLCVRTGGPHEPDHKLVADVFVSRVPELAPPEPGTHEPTLGSRVSVRPWMRERMSWRFGRVIRPVRLTFGPTSIFTLRGNLAESAPEFARARAVGMTPS
jgi:hypothetical protein